MQNIVDKFLKPFCINGVVCEKNLAQHISHTEDLFKIIRKCCLPVWGSEL